MLQSCQTTAEHRSSLANSPPHCGHLHQYPDLMFSPRSGHPPTNLTHGCLTPGPGPCSGLMLQLPYIPLTCLPHPPLCPRPSSYTPYLLCVHTLLHPHVHLLLYYIRWTTCTYLSLILAYLYVTFC